MLIHLCKVCMFTILSNLIITALITKCHVQHVEKILEGGTKELSIIWILLVECTPCLLTSYPGILFQGLCDCINISQTAFF